MQFSMADLRELLLTPQKAESVRPAETPKLRILVLQRGWVVIGKVSQVSDQELFVTAASVIRIWGTKNGLGELAKSGPTKDTKLDPCGTLRVHPLTTIMQIDCVEESWKS